MVVRRALLVVWVAAALAPAGEAPAQKGPKRVVVVQDKTPVLFEQNQIGELAEGTRLEVRQRYAGWVMVRAQFGPNWFMGWVREAAVAPDSLANVDIKVAPTRPTTAYRRPDTRRLITPPAGNDFLEVRVKFEPREGCAPKAYFDFHDPDTADLYVRYRGGKATPYAFIRKVEGITLPTFEQEEKRQTLILEPGKSFIHTYLFVVPPRIRSATLVLKDRSVEVPLRR